MIAIQGYLKEVGIVVELDYQETAIWTSKGIYETDGGMILAVTALVRTWSTRRRTTSPSVLSQASACSKTANSIRTIWTLF